jgi:TPR repeat protein
MLEYGDGIAKDLLQAREWYQKASAQGHEGAKDALVCIEKEIKAEQSTNKPAVAMVKNKLSLGATFGIWGERFYSGGRRSCRVLYSYFQ